MADTRRYNKLLSTKGTLKVELKKVDGGVMPFSIVFNGQESPETTIKLAIQDWVGMQNGEVNGQMLFLKGQMKFNGDPMFLMSLQQLI